MNDEMKAFYLQLYNLSNDIRNAQLSFGFDTSMAEATIQRILDTAKADGYDMVCKVCFDVHQDGKNCQKG